MVRPVFPVFVGLVGLGSSAAVCAVLPWVGVKGRTQQQPEERGKRRRKPENRPRPVFRVFSLSPLASGLSRACFLLPWLRAAKRNQPKRQGTQEEEGRGREGETEEGAQGKGPEPGTNTPHTTAGARRSLSGGAFVFWSSFSRVWPLLFVFAVSRFFLLFLFFPPGAAVLAVCPCFRPIARALRLRRGGPVLVRIPRFSLHFPFLSRAFRPHVLNFACSRFFVACFS